MGNSWSCTCTVLRGLAASKANPLWVCRDKLANVFGLGPVGGAKGREWLSLGGDEVALAGAAPACGGQEVPMSFGT